MELIQYYVREVGRHLPEKIREGEGNPIDDRRYVGR
jgi:hypothetical protein